LVCLSHCMMLFKCLTILPHIVFRLPGGF
jgi:hypothetical protein